MRFATPSYHTYGIQMESSRTWIYVLSRNLSARSGTEHEQSLRGFVVSSCYASSLSFPSSARICACSSTVRVFHFSTGWRRDSHIVWRSGAAASKPLLKRPAYERSTSCTALGSARRSGERVRSRARTASATYELIRAASTSRAATRSPRRSTPCTTGSVPHESAMHTSRTSLPRARTASLSLPRALPSVKASGSLEGGACGTSDGGVPVKGPRYKGYTL